MSYQAFKRRKAMASEQPTSPLFCASDADVTFSSSDGVLFKIHRKYLEVNAGAFPPAEFATNDETVMLTESSAILELLFQFVYPKQHPDFDDIEPFELFAGVAEAAEKYEIYPAMSTCKLRMRHTSVRPSSTTTQSMHGTVLAYACKHGYMDIADVAAPLTLGAMNQPEADITPLLTLSQAVVMAYLTYAARWDATLRKGVLSCDETTNPNRNNHVVASCDRGRGFKVIMRLTSGPKSLLDVPAIFDFNGLYFSCPSCPVCYVTTSNCQTLLDNMISQIPKFSTFLTI